MVRERAVTFFPVGFVSAESVLAKTKATMTCFVAAEADSAVCCCFSGQNHRKHVGDGGLGGGGGIGSHQYLHNTPKDFKSVTFFPQVTRVPPIFNQCQTLQNGHASACAVHAMERLLFCAHLAGCRFRDASRDIRVTGWRGEGSYSHAALGLATQNA